MSAARTASAHTNAGWVSWVAKYAMSVTASPALLTADSAAATNDRPSGYRRSSEAWDKNTRRGGGSDARSPDTTHSMPETPAHAEAVRRQFTDSHTDLCKSASSAGSWSTSRRAERPSRGSGSR